MPNNFDSVGAFHRKFDLPTSSDLVKPGTIASDLRDFRLKFLLEELAELAEGYGLRLRYELTEEEGAAQDLPKIADALVDLVYVALGTAHFHGFPWEELFAEVQRANITKVRCGIDHKFEPSGGEGGDTCKCGEPRKAHSLRGSAHDVIKPQGWTGPAIIEVLMRAGWPGPALPLEEKK